MFSTGEVGSLGYLRHYNKTLDIPLYINPHGHPVGGGGRVITIYLTFSVTFIFLIRAPFPFPAGVR
jgi:hypothetical protein